MATATIRATKVSRNTSGWFGAYGGRYVTETLMSALEELEREYEKAKRDRKFRRRLDELLRTFAGRPTPLFFARRFFFFQAEDGIRDVAVTGVQTCALPI